MVHTYELVLDILNGCKWNCMGCTVDRLTIHNQKEHELKRLEKFLLHEKNTGSTLMHFEIGPTDFLTCENLEDVLNDRSVQSLIKNFEYIFLTSTLLSQKDIEKRLDLICRKLKGKKVYLFIPMQLERLQDKNFTQILFQNLEFLRQQSTAHFTIEKVYANVLDIPYFTALSYQEKLSLISWLHNQVKIKVNFNYRLAKSTSPQHYSYISSVEFLPILLREVRALDKLYDEINVPDIYLDNKKRRGILFKDGQLFWMPYLGKFTASIENEFLVNDEVDYSRAIDLYEVALKGDQINYLPKTRDCADCDFLSICLNRGVIEAMKVYDHTNCIIPDDRKHYWDSLKAVR